MPIIIGFQTSNPFTSPPCGMVFIYEYDTDEEFEPVEHEHNEDEHEYHEDEYHEEVEAGFNIIEPWYFDHLMCQATYDRTYPKCGWEATELDYDILFVLHPYFKALTDRQIVQFANVICDRRDRDGDIERSVQYFLMNHYTTYMTKIYPIIKFYHESSHVKAMRKHMEERISVFRLASQRKQMPWIPAEVFNYMARTFLGIEDAN